MQIDPDALVMVVDGGKMLLFRNRGDAEYPNLEVEEAVQQDDAPDRDQKADSPGRAFSSASDRRSAYEETDFHDQAESRFAADAVKMLNRRAMANDYERLIIVAPPGTLGEMRKHYHKTLQARLVGEIGKDLASHPVLEIERIIRES